MRNEIPTFNALDAFCSPSAAMIFARASRAARIAKKSIDQSA